MLWYDLDMKHLAKQRFTYLSVALVHLCLLTACTSTETITLNATFTTAPLPEQASYFDFLEYTAKDITLYSADSPVLKNLLQGRYAKALHQKNTAALVLRLELYNPNSDINLGNGYGDVPLGHVAKIIGMNGDATTVEHAVLINENSAVGPKKTITAYSIFAVPKNLETVSILLGDQANAYTLQANFAAKTFTVHNPEIVADRDLGSAPNEPPDSTEHLPGCWYDQDNGPWVNIGLYRGKERIGEYLPSKRIEPGEDVRIDYVWHGWGKIEVTPDTQQVPVHNYQAYSMIHPTKTTTYTLTPTIRPGCAVTFTVEVAEPSIE
jgi:hypothetical protein